MCGRSKAATVRGGDSDLNDYLDFSIGAPKDELPGAPDGGARYWVDAQLAGRTFARFHIDGGFGDAVTGQPRRAAVVQPRICYSQPLLHPRSKHRFCG